MQAKNIKRATPTRVQVALDLRKGSRTSRVDTRRPKGGRQGARRAAIEKG
jgi:hypothetical protein